MNTLMLLIVPLMIQKVLIESSCYKNILYTPLHNKEHSPGTHLHLSGGGGRGGWDFVASEGKYKHSLRLTMHIFWVQDHWKQPTWACHHFYQLLLSEKWQLESKKTGTKDFSDWIWICKIPFWKVTYPPPSLVESLIKNILITYCLWSQIM